MSEYVVSVLMSNAVSHCLATIAASEFSERGRLGDRKIFTVYLKSSGSSVWKARLGISATTACEMSGVLYLIYLALCIHVISIDTLTFSLENGEIVFQILGRLYIFSML